ncbi:unnamed protein product [Cuscuta europaea]|uniref:Uncharacterized protein n=1 Tax=Cuscuta europaea TaxID=41803 RepID=A0A9P0ZVL2_CUSEU|nr:unnamed protein product [Cuscuta europaea]
MFVYFCYAMFAYLYFVFIRSNIMGGRFLVWFTLVARFLFRGNQADSTANSLKAHTFPAISVALFGVDCSMSDKEVRGPMGLRLCLFRRRAMLDDLLYCLQFSWL